MSLCMALSKPLLSMQSVMVCGVQLSNVITIKQYLAATARLGAISLSVQNTCVPCRGQIDVMDYLGQEADLHSNMSVLFLTPCHATPYYSHIHRDISMEFLDCSPPG